MHWIDASAAQLGFSRLQRQDFANDQTLYQSVGRRLGFDYEPPWEVKPIADGLPHAKVRGNL